MNSYPSAMRIQFCGADRTVTGSCHLVEIKGKRFLLDLGMYQGRRDDARRINQLLPTDIKSIDAIILTHGHLDHCGRLPMAVRAGFSGPIYCTSATADVARIVMEDAADIQVEDAAYLNRRVRVPGEPAVEPLFRRGDAETAVRQFRRVTYRQPIDVGGVTITYYDAGHILGSAYVILRWAENGAARSLLFTGDIGRYHTPIISDPAVLEGPVDQVITESTYGNRSHAPMEAVEDQLLDALRWCIERKSRLVVPAFAVGRTQTILWYVQKFIHERKIPPIPVFVDSPMGVEVSRVHSNHREYYDEQTRQLIGQKDLFGLARVTFASSVEQSKQINSAVGACVIIASSPTCEFGRILHHVKLSIERENDLIVFVGWTPYNTLGRRLQDGQGRVRIYDRFYDVRCQVRTIHGLSAHADYEELLRFLSPTIRPDTDFCVVHGEADSADDFAGKLSAAGAGRVMVPAMESTVF